MPGTTRRTKSALRYFFTKVPGARRGAPAGVLELAADPTSRERELVYFGHRSSSRCVIGFSEQNPSASETYA